VLTLVLGGARSGKSELAERLVLRHVGEVAYFATGVVAAGDDDMAGRVRRHQERRGERFRTVETGADLAGALRREMPQAPAIVDALGTWLAAHESFATDSDDLCAALAGRTGPTVVVSEEVGLGVHPATAVGRDFRDALGLLNQAVAAIADDVLLVVAGRALRLEDPDDLPFAGGSR
jgi:adenosyl cobinamide kinase/adenosyl cobinamide phosphate guanylyltransferase